MSNSSCEGECADDLAWVGSCPAPFGVLAASAKAGDSFAGEGNTPGLAIAKGKEVLAGWAEETGVDAAVEAGEGVFISLADRVSRPLADEVCDATDSGDTTAAIWSLNLLDF